MLKITSQQNFAGNNIKLHQPFSKFYSSDRYLWLKDPFAKNDTKTKQEIINKTTAAGIIFMALSLCMLSKSFQKSSKKILEKLSGYFNKKNDASILDESKPKTYVYSYIAQKMDSFLRKTESLNNITSLKDILFMKFMYGTKLTRKIHSGISDLFEHVSAKTVHKSYKKTEKLFNQMYEKFDKLDEYILKHYSDKTVFYKNEKVPVPVLIKQAKEYRENVKIVVDAFISKNTQKIRYDSIKKTTSTLYSSFWNESFKGFWSKDNKFGRKQMWQTFIASEQIKANKTDLASNVSFARHVLSYTPQEKSLYISEYLKNLRSILPAEDSQGTDILKRLEWYINSNFGLTENRDNFLLELEKLEKHPLQINGDKKFVESQLKDKDTNIQMIRNMANDDDNGDLGDMLSIYSKIALFELSKSGALNLAQKSVESFDRSVHLEVGELFDKFRDLQLGSAPTDILTLIFSSSMIIWGLGKAQNSEEKTSVILKSGIPVIGGIATTMISTTKLISGGKSLALGFISGLILNRIGVIVDNLNKNLRTTHKS